MNRNIIASITEYARAIHIGAREIKALCFIAMTAMLYLSFYSNPFRVVPSWDHFTYFRQGEFLVLKAIVVKREQPYSSWPMRGRVKGQKWKAHADYILERRTPTGISTPYISQAGLGGWTYYFMDFGLTKLGLPAEKRLAYMKGATALVFAVVMSALVMMIAAEFGIVGAAIAFAAIFFSIWLTLFARSLYWMTFLWFLPILWCWRYYIARPPPQGKALAIFSLGFFVLFIIKMLAGFEFTPAIAIASGAIIVYGLSKDGFLWGKIFRHGSLLVANAIAAFVTALMITGAMIFIILNRSMTFIQNYFYERFAVRTYGEEKRAWVNDMSAMDVVARDLNADLWGSISALYIFSFLILCGLAFLFIIVLQDRAKLAVFWQSPIWQRSAALFLFGLLSFLASIGYFVLHKNHAVLHKVYTPIVWSVTALIIFPVIIWAMAQKVRSIKLAAGTAIACLLIVEVSFLSYHALNNRGKILKTEEKIRNGALQPVIKSDFDIYLDRDARHLVYVNDRCGLQERRRKFFVHVFFADKLESEFKAYAFGTRSMLGYVKNGYYGISKCIILWDLPNEKVRRIRTGQFEEVLPPRRWHHFWEGWAACPVRGEFCGRPRQWHNFWEGEADVE